MFESLTVFLYIVTEVVILFIAPVKRVSVKCEALLMSTINVFSWRKKKNVNKFWLSYLLMSSLICVCSFSQAGLSNFL